MWRRSSHLIHHLHRLLSPSPFPSPPSLLPFFHSLSTSNTTTAPPSDLARSIAADLAKLSSCPPSPPSFDLHSYFNLHYSDVTFNQALFRDILFLSPPTTSARLADDLFRDLVRNRSFHPSDASLALLIHHLSRRHDFKPALDLLSDFHQTAGTLAFSSLFLGLSRAGRPTQAIKFFSSLPPQHWTKDNLSSLISALAENGLASHAEQVMMQFVKEIFPDESMCIVVIRGYCAKGKLNEALQLLSESRGAGFELGTPAYNAILDCVCKLARKKDPLSLHSEAKKVLISMESIGIPRDAETFRVLITHLCKIRKTEDAMKLFRKTSEWGCSPDSETYLVLVKSLYQAGRVSEGDQMIEFMRADGFGDKLDRKAYYGFIKVLCGIERIEHAMNVFRMMKGYGHASGIKTYTRLIEKLAIHNMGDCANALYKEAVARGVVVTPGVYKVDKRYLPKKAKVVKKKRPTLPEKMIMKSKRLYKLKRSFVRKSSSRMGRRTRA